MAHSEGHTGRSGNQATKLPAGSGLIAIRSGFDEAQHAAAELLRDFVVELGHQVLSGGSYVSEQHAYSYSTYEHIMYRIIVCMFTYVSTDFVCLLACLPCSELNEALHNNFQHLEKDTKSPPKPLPERRVQQKTRPLVWQFWSVLAYT